MTASKRATGSDLAKVDAYQNTQADYAETPELDDAFFARAMPDVETVARRGRPPVGDQPKQAVSLRLDRNVVAHYKAGGPGWQTRMNDVLAAGMDVRRRHAETGEYGPIVRGSRSSRTRKGKPKGSAKT